MSDYDSDTHMVSGLFHDRESAENAYRALAARGYSKDDVTVVMSDETRQRLFSDDEPSSTTDLGLKSGGILLSVKPRSDEDATLIEQSWRDSGAAGLAGGRGAMRPDAR